MAEEQKRLLKDPVARINHDLQILFDQQKKIQKLSKDYSSVEIKLYQSTRSVRSYAQNSLYWFNVTNPVRKAAISMVFNPWFDRFILVSILANCVFLAIDDPTEEETEDQRIAELVFLVIFTIEMIIKVVALGFVLERNSYLRDPWNILDFVVVFVGWISTFMSAGNISAIRTIRILRPLRTINSIPEMKILVNSIIKSLPLLIDIFILFMFILLVFSIIGLQSYAGMFQQRCHDGITQEVADWDSGELCYLPDYCKEYELDCGPSGCDEDQYCWKTGANPDDGVTAFDNIMQSMLTVFTAITLEGWTADMYWAREVSDSKYIGDIYFILMVFLGAYIVINLIIAVQYDTLVESTQEQQREIENREDEGEDEEEYLEGEMRFEPQVPKDNEEVEITSGCAFHWYKFRRWMFQVATSKGFNILIALLIIINTIILSSDHYPMTEEHTMFMEVSNIVLTALFGVEMVMKLIGLSCRGYVADIMNIFDGLLVIIGLIDIIVLQDSAAGVTVLRAFRLFRILKLARSWEKLNNILVVMFKSFQAIMHLGLLCILCIFIYALMGTQFYAKQLKDEEGESPRSNFDHIGWSMITIFQILSGENWNEVMYMAIDQTGWQASVYFVSLVVIGNYILFNLFLAILLGEFDKEDDEDKDGSSSDESGEEEEQLQDPNPNRPPNYDVDKRPSFADVDRPPIYDETNPQSSNMSGTNVSPQRAAGERRRTEAQMKAKADKQKAKDKHEAFLKSRKIELGENKSCFLFAPDHPLRMALLSLLYHPYFDEFIYGLIAASSIVLAIDEPNISDYKKQIVNILHMIFLALFILEMTIKVIVMGFVVGKKAYLKDSWNRLDFFIVIVGIVDLLLTQAVADSDVDLRFLRALRALRALRPLRMVSRNQGMKIVVSSVMMALPVVVNVFLILMLFYLIFGILGVIFFKGALYQCTDPNIDNEDDCIGYFINATTGVIVQRDWRNSPFNFDNIFMSMLTLYEISSLEMWPDYMYLAIDSVAPGKAPERNHNPAASIYFIFFIFFTTFFIMNLFVGVVIDEFEKIKKELNGTAILSPDQQNWVKIQRLLMKWSPQIRYQKPVHNRLRSFLFDIVTHKNFELAIMGIICLNVMFMMLYHYDMPSDLEDALFWGNIAFVIIYILEAAVKLTALFPRYYFADDWNKFDFIIVVLSLVFISDEVTFINATVLRVLRIARLFRIVKVSKGLKRLFYTMITSLPSLVDVGTLLLLLVFVYGVAGMDLFSEIKKGEHINKHANFDSFYNAVLTLIRASTGESWNGLMHDCMQTEYDNDDDSCVGQSECGAWYYSVPYWITFTLIASAVFLNIFIAVILSNFQEIIESEKQDIILVDGDIKNYEDTWARFCPYAQHHMPTVCLPDFLNELKPPLGFWNQNLTIYDMLKIVKNTHIIENEGQVHFAHLLWALASSIHGTDMNGKDGKPKEIDTLDNIAKSLHRRYPTLGLNVKQAKSLSRLYEPEDTTKESQSASKTIAGLIILQNWRKYKERRAMNRKLKELSSRRLGDHS